jgi:hypothetical protein
MNSCRLVKIQTVKRLCLSYSSVEHEKDNASCLGSEADVQSIVLWYIHTLNLNHLGLIQLHADEDTNKLNSMCAIYNG